MSTLLLTVFQFSKHFDAPLNFHDCFRPPSFIYSRSFSLTRKKTESGEKGENVRRLKRAPYYFLILFVYFLLYENEAFDVIKNVMVTARRVV